MIQLKTALALSVAAVLGSTVLTLSASTPPATAAVTCQPVAIVAFRGSGEKNLAPTAATLAGASHNYAGTALTTNGWEGQTLQRILTA